MENISQTQKVLTNKSEAIPDLVAALEDAKNRFKEADKARKQKHKADELKKELAWSYVASKQQVGFPGCHYALPSDVSFQEFRKHRLEVEKQEKRVKDVQVRLDESKAS